MPDNQQKQLFTELTPEEGAVIQGGATITIIGFEALEASADGVGGGGDDPYIKFNGQRKWERGGVNKGDKIFVNTSFGFSGKVKVEFTDNDPGGRDDTLGNFEVNDVVTNAVVSTTIAGSGSSYRVYYAVFP
ncbi:MAG: hypothetical protein QNJ55_17285 [Xenococcus sp. MO_188.B8]|nr:hypothetical protein [Xenococcus sp. MO_188.B8]